MPAMILSVEEGSIAACLGIQSGDVLLSIDGHDITDVLDYRFYMTESQITLALMRAGKPFTVTAKKDQYADIGLEFDSYLMDKQHSCTNKCVFCFVDQMPKGMRKTLYFKDDDSRMSFFFGNYVTLTNMTDEDIRRIIKMKLSPINVSVHTTDPALRIEMMKNPRSGKVLHYIQELCAAGIKVNAQLVLCPGINDGDALDRTLGDLAKLYPNLQSIACVPVGLTKFREGLAPLTGYTPKTAAETVARIHQFADMMQKLHGERVAYPSDEFFLAANIPIPDPAYYGGFDQLEDGVGMLALLKDEFLDALEQDERGAVSRRCTVATGEAAAPWIRTLAAQAMQKLSGLVVEVRMIQNDFFGPQINVAGLVTGTDIKRQLSGAAIGEELLIPQVMLRHEGDCFLDDVTVAELSGFIGCPVRAIPNDGYLLYQAMTGAVEG